MLSRMTWADRIREALANDAFVLHAQPVLSLDGDPTPRSELLLRMLGENGDLIPPGELPATSPSASTSSRRSTAGSCRGPWRSSPRSRRRAATWRCA